MIYVYDILLNLKEEFYEFYEWEKNDYIYHIKKIPIIKISTELMELLLTKRIKLSKEFANNIYGKVELFGSKKGKYLKYGCLFTDGYKVIGVELNDNFEACKISDLLLDEASDVIEISSRAKESIIEYTILGNKKNNYFLTRREYNIKLFLEEELKKMHKKKETSKLEYLYFEYFNKSINDIEVAYKELRKSLKDDITLKHVKLYNLLNLKGECDSVENLTK